MDRPLGYAIGNSLEVIEAIETLQGRGPADLTEVCLALATHMLVIGGHGDEASCRGDIRRVIENGEALATLARMVGAQGGDPAWIYDAEKFPKAAHTHTVLAPQDGYITHADAEGYGIAALLLGAGRNTKEDEIDYAAGIRLAAKTGDYVRKGELLATLYANNERLFAQAESRLLAATEIGAAPPAARPLILDIVE
jgi:pyrimidine-nucleoside phosphorylase